MCPLKTFKIKQEKEPWLSNQLIELIKDKDYALKRAKSKKDPVLWTEAKKLRNNCTKRLHDARADYIKENLEINLGNQKKFWKNIQNVISSSKKANIGNFKQTDQDSGIDIDENDTAQYNNCTKRLRDARADYIKENLEINLGNQKKFWKNIQNVIPLSKKANIGNFKQTDQDSGIDIDENDTAQYINDFFVNIGPNLASKCDQPWRFDGNLCPNNIDPIYTDVDEIIKLCKDININRSSCI